MTDIYVQAYRAGGVEAVNTLLRRQFPGDEERVRAVKDLEQTGLWKVLWHRSSRTGRLALGVVMEYLGR